MPLACPQVLRISGYTAHEKQHIARQYLQPQAAADAGVPASAVQITDDAMTQLITEYCRWGFCAHSEVLLCSSPPASLANLLQPLRVIPAKVRE